MWLRHAHVPLCISAQVLRRRLHLPRARGRWILDSGGFTELAKHGRWTICAEEYATLIARADLRMGPHLQWAACQDWLCTPAIRTGTNGFPGTGLSVDAHQHRTVQSVLDLQSLLRPEGLQHLIAPVLQGETPEDYLRHVDLYASAGVDLQAAPAVGVGAIAHRQDDPAIRALCVELSRSGLRLHGFGVKTRGIPGLADTLTSADSMAWSMAARRATPLAGCDHARCTTCPVYAMQWRDSLLARLRAHR